MIQVQEGRQFDATLEGAPTGLTGTIGVRLIDPATSTTLVARTTAGIVEYPAGSGVYGVALTAPAIGSHPSPWTVNVLWDTVSGGTPLTPASTFTEDLIIYAGPVPGVPGIEGTPYFTVAEFRTRYPELDEGTYSDDLVNEYRELAEQAFEDACDRAFVPRTATDTIVDQPTTNWTGYPGEFDIYDFSQTAYRPYRPRRLTHPDIRQVTSAADSASNAIDITNVAVAHGWVHGLNAAGTITITYTYGLDTPPLRVKHAVMALTREWMVSGPVTDRQTGIPTEGGGTISLALPGGRYGTFGLPEIDAAVEQYGSPRAVVA